MRDFAEWLANEVPANRSRCSSGFNAVFDWMFVDDYFHRCSGHNPFGHTALDMKSYCARPPGGTWTQTSMRYLSPLFLGGRKLAHNALGDAQDQAELFRARSAPSSRRERAQ